MLEFLNNLLGPFYPLMSCILMALIFLLILKLLKVKMKTIITILVNILVGGIVLCLINYIPGINITVDIWRSLAVGVFGVPAVIVIVVLYFLGY